jgi:ribonuclease E
VIDRTEAMTVVDVNTGKFVGSGGNLEETVTKNNLEAAEEIVRQLRLRDIGGIIVVDFIDMVLESNRDDPRAAPSRRAPQPRSHQAPGRRGDLARPRADDAQEARPAARPSARRARSARPWRDRAPRPRSSSTAARRRPHRPAAVGRARTLARHRRRQRSRSGGTHVITESAKSALAQIAASTIHTAAEDAQEAAEVAEDIARRQPEAAPERAKRPARSASRLSLLGQRAEREGDPSTRCWSALPEPKAPARGGDVVA